MKKTLSSWLKETKIIFLPVFEVVNIYHSISWFPTERWANLITWQMNVACFLLTLGEDRLYLHNSKRLPIRKTCNKYELVSTTWIKWPLLSPQCKNTVCVMTPANRSACSINVSWASVRLRLMQEKRITKAVRNDKWVHVPCRFMRVRLCLTPAEWGHFFKGLGLGFRFRDKVKIRIWFKWSRPQC